jgi:hypothetical protein
MKAHMTKWALAVLTVTLLASSTSPAPAAGGPPPSVIQGTVTCVLNANNVNISCPGQPNWTVGLRAGCTTVNGQVLAVGFNANLLVGCKVSQCTLTNVSPGRNGCPPSGLALSITVP